MVLFVFCCWVIWLVYIFWIYMISYSRYMIWNTFSNSVACLFILMMVYFTVPEFIFLKSWRSSENSTHVPSPSTEAQIILYSLKFLLMLMLWQLRCHPIGNWLQSSEVPCLKFSQLYRRLVWECLASLLFNGMQYSSLLPWLCLPFSLSPTPRALLMASPHLASHPVIFSDVLAPLPLSLGLP